jgi:hypothetical protein
MCSGLKRRFAIVTGCIECVDVLGFHWCFSKMGDIIGKYKRVVKAKNLVVSACLSIPGHNFMLSSYFKISCCVVFIMSFYYFYYLSYYS